MHAFQQMMDPDRVRFTRVRPPEEDDVRLLHLPVGVGSSARSEDRRQTDDARRVSGAVAAVDVVVPKRHARELLRQEVHFVGGLAAREDPQRVRAVPFEIPAEALRGGVQRDVPRRREQFAAAANEWLGEAWIRNRILSSGHGFLPIGLLAQNPPFSGVESTRRPGTEAPGRVHRVFYELPYHCGGLANPSSPRSRSQVRLPRGRTWMPSWARPRAYSYRSVIRSTG